MERLAGQLTHARQGERVVAWQMRPYQHGYPADELAWYCTAYGIEAGTARLEPLVLEQSRKKAVTHARTA